MFSFWQRRGCSSAGRQRHRSFVLRRPSSTLTAPASVGLPFASTWRLAEAALPSQRRSVDTFKLHLLIDSRVVVVASFNLCFSE